MSFCKTCEYLHITIHSYYVPLIPEQGYYIQLSQKMFCSYCFLLSTILPVCTSNWFYSDELCCNRYYFEKKNRNAFFEHHGYFQYNGHCEIWFTANKALKKSDDYIEW